MNEKTNVMEFDRIIKTFSLTQQRDLLCVLYGMQLAAVSEENKSPA